VIPYLTERIPLLVSPRWVFSRIQPAAIGDVLDYLVTALRVPESTGQIIERELLLVLEASLYGDRALFEAQPGLDRAPARVHLRGA